MLADAAVHVRRMELKGLILDFGGVFTKTRTRDLILRRCERELRLAPGTLTTLLFSGDHWWLVSTGEISADEYWAYICHALEGRVPTILEPFRYNPFAYEELNLRTAKLVSKWRKRYKIALLSNATPYLEALIAQHGLDCLFDVIVNSSRVGLRKPDIRIYELTLERLQLLPQECVFVDDKPRNRDVARALGISAVLFRSATSLERQVRALECSIGRGQQRQVPGAGSL